MELLKHQKELVKEFNQGNSVICNWSRGGGKTFMLAYLILEGKPQRVLLQSLRLVKETLNILDEKFSELLSMEFNKDLISNYNKSTRYIRIKFKNGIETEILIDDDNKGFDWVFYNDKLPEIDYSTEKPIHKNYISVITMNNANRRLQKEFNCKILEMDVFELVREGLYNAQHVREVLKYPNVFYSEYAILNQHEIDTMDFRDFQGKALQKLMKQFLSIPDSKDTVLTRKNIIEMIKDLKQLGYN